MLGTMMDFPLTLNSILERLGAQFPKAEVASRRENGELFRYTYRDFYYRTRRLAEALVRAGLRPGDRVATLMWNHEKHLECYFGIPAAGGVTLTLNLRLHPDEVAYITNHAGARFLIVDDCLLEHCENFRQKVNVEKIIVADFGAKVAHSFEDYEQFLHKTTGDFEYPKLGSDSAAAMCYTSGTTGKPKGVVYSHAALVLHSYSISLPDSYCLSHHDVILPCAPMFHANSHGVPFAAAFVGAPQVLPGPRPTSRDLAQLFHSEQVTFLSCVPTVWLGVLEELEAVPGRYKTSPKMRILCAGTAVPEAMIRRSDQLGIRIIHGWGMTETTPFAVVGTLKAHHSTLNEDETYALRAKQGYTSPFVEARIRNEQGVGAWDGVTMGELEVRGPWVAASYYDMPETADRWTEDGWFRTGDVATIDADGYIQLVDRSKDVIKSGGEWISSVDLENRLMAHPAVREAAVVGVPHPKWDERPLAVVVLKDKHKVTHEELRDFLSAKFAKWQLPDACVFVESLPRTSTGKTLKSALREKYKEFHLQAQGK